MKIVYEGGKILALASDDLQTTQLTLPAPPWFTVDDLGLYYVEGDRVLLKPVTQILPRQARVVLAFIPPLNDSSFPHFLAEVDAYFDSLPEPQRTVASVTWEYSTAVFRDNPLISQMQQVFPRLTDEVIDELFICANSVPENGLSPTLPIPVIPELPTESPTEESTEAPSEDPPAETEEPV